MKTFASTASRLRTYAAVLRAGGLAGLLLSAGWLVYILLRPAPKDAGIRMAAPSPPPQVDVQQRSEWLSVLESRSFHPLVQAPPPVVPMAAAKPVLAPSIEIVATMVNPGQTPRAFVRSKVAGGTGKLTSVQPGIKLDGVTIKEILDGQITVEVEGREFVIKVGRKPA